MASLLLDRYRPLAPLGSGGQADVFVAFDEQMKRRVAIKQVALSDVHASAAALEEARTAAMLNHPNIVTMYDLKITEQTAYLIMEYIDGVTLADIASEDITDEIIATVARDVGDALIFAHKNGVLHLDIKPANILINHEGHAKVIDFGVSALSQATGQPSATAGTIGYMPLEQLTGRAVTSATDDWAYAAVIYELLADEFPYEEQYAAARNLRKAPDALTTMQKLQTVGEPALLQTENPPLNDALATALTRNPEARFATTKDCRDALLKELPAPRAGRTQLAAIVAALTDDDAEHITSAATARSPFAGCFSVVTGIVVFLLLLAGLLY
ncbi:MAG: serine/threonine protein kinase [Coriobacteriia bacterium]|nr:serine/threonine protein kinase [Coriobacteriia bacterium]